MTTKTRKPTRSPVVATEFRFKGSRERAFGAGGELNASSTADLFKRIGSLIQAAATQEIVTEEAAEQGDLRKEHADMLLAAYQSPQAHRELGEILAAELYVVGNREGFMRRLLVKQDLNQGQIPICRVRMKNQVGTVADAPVQVQAQLARDEFFFPPEFYNIIRPFVEEREIQQSADDVLEEKFTEGLEGIMVQEDRTVKTLFDAQLNLFNPLITLASNLTPAALVAQTNQINSWGIPAKNMLFATDIWNDIAGDPVNWANVIDPASKNELLLNGKLGELYGVPIYTDAFRYQEHKVLNAGEVYTLGDPVMLGQYTDRGGLQSQPIDISIEKMPGRGWVFSELLSMIVANGRAVTKLVRS